MVVEIGGIEMEDYELEEGEACFYNTTTNDCGGSVDPDNDLSYIDEKLQNILGHFQKDFEGDFSAENLGAKFGGYGSFLPTYQRSPTSAKPQSSARTRSPNILLGESGNAASVSIPKKAKSGISSSKIPTKSMKSKKNSSSRQISTTKKPVVSTKQNALKLRIKMGSDNLSTEKNVAAIYSGLGLDVSPSLSLDNNSLSGSEGMNGEPQGYSLLDSPSSILNVMTFLPVDHCQLLSPLSDDLIHFIERENPRKDYHYTSPSRLFIESSSAMTNGLEPEKAREKPSVEKNRKMVDRKKISEDRNVRLKKGLVDGTNATVKESTETNPSYPTAVKKETTSSKLFDASKENYNGAARGESVGVERRLWGLTHHKDPGTYHENPKTNSAGSVPEDKNTKFGDDDTSGYSKELGKYKGSKAYDSVKKESSVSKVKSGHKAEPEYSSRKQKFDQIKQEPHSSPNFKEQKSSVVYEKNMNGQAEKKEVAVLKPQNDDKKAKDTYKDFFGDIDDSEEEEEHTCSLEVKDLPMSEKGLLAFEDIPGKSSVPLAESQNVSPGPILSNLGSDPSLPKANPVIIDEHWVACDKCGKWRLLPFGVLPKDLPEKWMCTMLNWLPGVNYCNVPEDETTKALYAMYQNPVPESQAPMQSIPSGSKPQFNQGDDNTKKKKKGFKKIENGMNKEISRTAETNKKTIQTSARNGIIHNLHGHNDLVDEKRQNNKHKGKTVDHRSDESRNLKIDNKRNADLESSMLAKKMKIESFLFPDEPEHGNGRPASSSGVHATSANQKPKPRVSSKMPKEEGRASDTGNSDSTRGSKKRKLKESRGSQVYSENENDGQKKTRLLEEENEHIFSLGNGKSDKKKMSHSKREYGHVQNLNAVTSSSSKISDSHKPRNSSYQARGSPVESVSSSPMRISNLEKSVYPRKKKGEYYDTNIFAADNLRRFPDGEGEDDGGSDRSQTRRKDKHGSHESSVLDVWDNKGSSKTKENAEPSLDANFENGGHKEFPRKLDHIHYEGKQSSDHRRSNDSLAKKSGKVSSSRSKDKSKSIRSDSRDGPRQFDKKIYNDSPNSRVDMAVRPNIPKPNDAERIIEKSNRADLPSPSQPPSRGVQGDSSIISARRKVEKCGTSDGNNNIEADDVRKATGQIRRKNEPSPSPLRKEVRSVQAANNILKEAKDLKHTADRLKNSVSNLEHIELYFQACFKFLHGAFLFETNSNDSGRQAELMAQSMSIYSSTANLCGFCAHEYEKSKDMGAAALAYKCMEAAYMRVVNSSCTSANKYRIELQTSLQMFPSGESPSSSASDVDNLNHPAAADKASTSRGISSPLVVGNHVISAQNRSNILRLLQYAQDVNLAMDASRKSRVALAAAMENLVEDQQQGEGIVSIKTALDYNFQDIEGLLHLVKLAMKANNR